METRLVNGNEMPMLFDASNVQAILSRIEQLNPSTQRQWGKMDVAQMLAHCCLPLEMALGHATPPRSLVGRILGGFFKHVITDPKPYKENQPTDKSFIITDSQDFEKQKKRIMQLVEQFVLVGENGMTTHPHPFFGKLTALEWGSAMYKHLDHHLKQFGV